MFESQTARTLAVRGSSFAVELVVQIGYWRFWKRWTVTQIHEVLTQERQLPICEREVLYLIGMFLVLLRSTYHLRIEAHAKYFAQHGLFVAIDALKPEKGNTALYVVRELKFGLVLQVVPVLSADQHTLARRVLEPIKALGYRVRGVVSDDERAICLAVQQVWPDVAHQTCQLHCLQEAATPIAAADQTFKKDLKKAIRAPFYAVCRALSQLKEDDPCQEVLTTYAELIRSTLTEGSKPPFALGGLRVFEDLTRIEASLGRSKKKGDTHFWINSWPWFNTAALSLPNIAVSNTSAIGWCNWTGSLIHPKTLSLAQPVAVLSNRSTAFLINWRHMLCIIRLMPKWSHTSAPPSDNAGRVCLLVMPGLIATELTMPWKLSLDVCAPVSVKFTAVSPSMNLSCAMASGLPSSIRMKPSINS